MYLSNIEARHYFDALPGGVISCLNDPAYTITYMNDWFVRITGYSRAELKSKLKNRLAALILPEDLETIRNGVRRSSDTPRSSELEYRILRKDGSTVWIMENNLYLPDNGGEFLCVISNISTKQRDIDSLRNKAEKDSLTGLVNRMTFEGRCSEYYHSAGQSTSALIIMDIDNFKEVNDCCGHLKADSVLIEIASTLKRSFRATDVVGRIGGDEMMILSKSIPDAAFIISKVNSILDDISKSAARLKLSCRITCSAGVAVFPDDGLSFSELFQKADSALYYAKLSGKNSVVLYSEMAACKSASYGGVRTEIDSDRALSPSGIDSMVGHAFNLLYEGCDFEASANFFLSIIGRQFDASRAYIFEISPDKLYYSIAYEWCASGAPREKKKLQSFDVRLFNSYFSACVECGGLFFCGDIRSLPGDIYDIVSPGNVKCMLSYKLKAGSVPFGFIGLDDCLVRRDWTAEQRELFIHLAQVFEIFLLNRRIRAD